jgi:hypothetical protein
MERRWLATVAAGLLVATANASQVLAGFAVQPGIVQITFLIVTTLSGGIAASLGVREPSKKTS